MPEPRKHEWHDKPLLYPQGKKAKVCKYCGAFYTGLNDNNTCAGLRPGETPPRRKEKA